MCITGNISLNPFNKLRKLNLLIPVVSTENRSTSPDFKRKQHNRLLEWTQFRKWTAGLGDLKAIHELTDGEVLSITPSILHLLRSPRVLVPNMYSCWLGSWILHHKVGVKTIWVLKDWSQSFFKEEGVSAQENTLWLTQYRKQDPGGDLKETVLGEKQTNCSATEWTEMRRGTEKEERKTIRLSGGPMTSLVAQTVKNLPAMQETRVWSLGQEDPLEKGMPTYCRILAWRTSWTEEPDKESEMMEQLSVSLWV